MKLTGLEVVILDVESVCLRCGRCCRLKKKVGRFHKLSSCDCEHLSFIDGVAFCSIYNNRLNTVLSNNNVCVSAEVAYESGLLPPDCPYIAFFNKTRNRYKCMVLDWRFKNDIHK